eukprot:5037295-Pyramimonas_sp.AAC.1
MTTMADVLSHVRCPASALLSASSTNRCAHNSARFMSTCGTRGSTNNQKRGYQSDQRRSACGDHFGGARFFKQVISVFRAESALRWGEQWR